MDKAPPGTSLYNADGQPLAPPHHPPYTPSEQDHQNNREALIIEGVSDGLSEDRSTKTNISTLPASQESISPQVSQKQQEVERGRIRQADKDRLARRFETNKRPPLAGSNRNRNSYIEGYGPRRRSGSATTPSSRATYNNVIQTGRFDKPLVSSRDTVVFSQVPRSTVGSGDYLSGSSAMIDSHGEYTGERSTLNSNDLERQMLQHITNHYSTQELEGFNRTQNDLIDFELDYLSQYAGKGRKSEKARLSADMTHAPSHQEGWSELPRALPSTAADPIQAQNLLPQLWSSWKQCTKYDSILVIGWHELLYCLEDSKPPAMQWEQYCRIIRKPESTDEVLQQARAFTRLVDLESRRTISIAVCLRLLTSWLSQAYHSARHARKESGSKGRGYLVPSEVAYLVQIFELAEDLFQRHSTHLKVPGTVGFIQELCYIARSTSYDGDLEACIRLFISITERTPLPHEELMRCVEILARVFNLVPQSREKAWDGLSRLLKSEKSGNIFQSMIGSTFLEDVSGHPYRRGKILLGVIERLVNEDITKVYPAITFDLLIKGISGIVEGSSSIKAYNDAAQIIRSLFDSGNKAIHPLVQNKDWSACFNIVIRCYQKFYVAVNDADALGHEPETASDLNQSTLSLIETLVTIKDKTWVEPSQKASIDRFLVDVSTFQSPKRHDSAFEQHKSNTSNALNNAGRGLHRSSEVDIESLDSHLEQNIQDSRFASDAVGVPFIPNTDEGLAHGAKRDSTDGANVDDVMSESVDGSEIESIFSTGSLPSSQSSQGGVFHLVVLEWAKLLVHDPALQLLYPAALSKVGPERFQRNFARFLKVYGKKLKEEASNKMHHEVASFVRQSARRTALEIRRMLNQDSEGLLTPLSLTMEVSRKIQVSQWLESHSARPESCSPETTMPAPNNDLSDMSDSEQSDTFERTSFKTLAETENFMVSSAAFSNLQQDFRAWLEIDKKSNPKRPMEPQNLTDSLQDEADSHNDVDDNLDTSRESDDPSIQTNKTFSRLQKESDNSQITETDGNENLETQKNVMLPVWSRLRFRIACILSPPLPGYQRVSYLCGCGQLSYVDLKELSAGGVEKFRQRLIKSAAAVRRRPQCALGSTVLERPPPAYLSSNESAHASRQERRMNPLLVEGSSRDNEADNDEDPDGSTLGRQSDLAHDLQYLLLCVHTRTSTTLVHVEVSRFSNDQYLFEELRRAYQRARKENEWKLYMIIPIWLQKIIQAVSKKLLVIPGYEMAFAGLGRAVRQISLYRIASGDFVRFQLVPIREKCCPTWFKAREFPPPSEVIAKRYLYEPVPMDDVEFADIPLAHLLQPGPHLDTFWKSVFPKKLCEELQRPAMSGGRVVGWGVRINESLNWSIVLLGIFLLLLFIGVIVVVYSAMTSDNSSAFGLGAFLMAIFTVYITYQYFAWREKM